MRTEIDLNEREHFLEANLDRSEIDSILMWGAIHTKGPFALRSI